jgi:factor associated with neutral sphingomyelinase activation
MSMPHALPLPARRFREMSSDSFNEGATPPFLYGTHYSTPGYVMFWLVRAAPAHLVGTIPSHESYAAQCSAIG